MEDGAVQPSDELLARFGVRLVASLGGRLNQHWLVETRQEQLVLRRWAQPVESVVYELRLLEQLAARGWPVAPALAGPVEEAGHHWTLMPFLPGEPPSTADGALEQRARGRLLAQLHADTAELGWLGQRPPWRRCEAILADATLDEVLQAAEQERGEEVRIVRWHLDRARERVAGLQLHERPGVIIHGDFTPWIGRFQDGRLSGILDFELTRWDHRIGDFVLAWRGKYDAVVHSYHELAPLEPAEWALLTPLWWAYLVEQACWHLRTGTYDNGWNIKKLLERSPLMGPDAVPCR